MHNQKPNPQRNEPTCEHYQGKKKQQQEKAAFYARNPHRKWGK